MMTNYSVSFGDIDYDSLNKSKNYDAPVVTGSESEMKHLYSQDSILARRIVSEGDGFCHSCRVPQKKEEPSIFQKIKDSIKSIFSK